MGVNIGLNAATTAGLLIIALLIAFVGVLLIAAVNKTDQIPRNNTNTDLNSTSDQLRTSYILAFISAGIILLLGILFEISFINFTFISFILSIY